MQGQAGKRKTDGKVPSNTEQNCPDLFERPRFVCIMQAPLVQMRTVPSETGHFPKVISLNGSCSRSYLLSMPHIRSYLIRCPTENFRDAAPCGEITIFLVHSTLPLEWFTPVCAYVRVWWYKVVTTVDSKTVTSSIYCSTNNYGRPQIATITPNAALRSQEMLSAELFISVFQDFFNQPMSLLLAATQLQIMVHVISFAPLFVVCYIL